MDLIEYTIRGVPAALDAALRRRARERATSLNQTVIETLAAALEVAHADGEPGSADAGTDLPPAPEQDALDEGMWL